MNKICLLCNRTSPDSNLFCQEPYCPAETSPYLLDHGEWLGDIEIIRTVAILQTSVLYVARHNQRQVLLKVAYPGLQHTERLKREATLLRDMISKGPVPSLPTLLPPYMNTTIDKDPYGRTQLGEHLLYFCIFTFFEGDSLRDILLKNPQLWAYHVGWIMTALAAAVAVLQSKNIYHYGLSPETALVHLNEQTNTPQVLLCDLGIASDRHTLSDNWYPALVAPAYTAPELINAVAQPEYATDVYGLGLILYEMLVGEPAFPFKQRGDREAYAAVRNNQRARMNRIEDIKDIATLALAAVDPLPSNRPHNAADFAEALLKNFGPPPPPRRRTPNPRTALVATAVVLLIAFVITFGLNLSSMISKLFASL